MNYAVIRTGGKQFRVAEGDTLEVDRLSEEKDANISFDDVLLWVAGDQVRIGDSKVEGIKVEAKVLNQLMGDKVRVAKFKAKSRYRRVMGFRPQLTKVRIERIGFSDTRGVNDSAVPSQPINAPTPRRTGRPAKS